jgi:hypothetical protein
MKSFQTLNSKSIDTKRKKLIKRIGFLIVVLLVVYIIMVCISVVKTNYIKTITFSSSAYGVTINSTEIDLTNKTIHNANFHFNGTLQKEQTNALSVYDFNKLKATCILCCVPLWKKTYENSRIMDGDYWEIELIDKDGKKKTTNGHEAYPVTYGFFLHELKTIQSQLDQ